MAVFTEVSAEDALRVARAHGLGGEASVAPIAAGSVNSNFWLEAGGGRWFLRVYEQAPAEGVAYEWALLEHLARRGVPVPSRLAGPPPGDLRVGGKPVAVFGAVEGVEVCQALVCAERASAVGRALAAVHGALDDFPLRRASRFGPEEVRGWLAALRARAPAFRGVAADLEEALDEGEAALGVEGLDRGVVHGDLFRDNVRWRGPEIASLLDWESASDGVRVYDLLVTVLAWCFGDHMRWELAAALVAGYREVRELGVAEARAMRGVALVACARFATTRILDFEERPSLGARVHKDYRRFLARLEAFRALDAREVAVRLGVDAP